MAMRKKVLLIEEMTCANCQNKIEQALRNTAGISKVNVSYNKGQAEVEFDNEILTLEQITHIIQDLDYTVVQRRKTDYKKTFSSIGTFAIIICLYYLLQRLGVLNLLVPSMLADSTMSYGMLFVVGLLTSVHCIAMCGGINLSQCIPSGKDDSGNGNSEVMPSLLYNTGRVISYAVIGFLLGGIGMIMTGGSETGIPLILQGILKIIAGLFMVSSAVYGNPQRSATGFDIRRMNMLLAVLEKRVGFKLAQKDVFLNIAGGLKVNDPAIDLAVISAILSSNMDTAIEPEICMAGEIGLSGEIRPVNRIEQRIGEAEKLGFKRFILPKYNLQGLNTSKLKIELIPVRKVEEAFRALFG